MPEYTIAELEKLTEKMGGEMKAKWADFIAQMKQAGETTVQLSSLSKDMADALLAASAVAKETGNIIVDAFAKGGKAVAIFNAMLGSATTDMQTKVIGAITVFERLFLNVLPSGKEAFGSMAESGTAAGTQIAKSFEVLKKPLDALLQREFGGFGKGLSDGLMRVAEATDSVINMERNLVRMAAAAGDMDSVMGRSAATFTDLDTAAMTYVGAIRQASLATGIGTEEVSKYAEALGTAMPGALRKTQVSIGGTIGTIDQMTAGLKIASAFQLDYNQISEDTKLAYRELNMDGRGALEMIAGMAMAAKDSALPLDTMRNYVLETAKSFKMFGDNAQGAIAILRGMKGALQESGMGPEAIRDLVSGMTAGIRDMDIAHKAFISAQTGGRGGLAGAFEMDWLLRQGKTEEVMSRTMNAMQRQFGGPIVTLEEVQQTPALAGQLMKQVAFLTDVAGIAKDKASAYRILEGMKRGAPEMIAEAKKDPTEQMREVVTAVTLGHDIQKKTNTWLKEIETHSKTTAMASAITAKKEFGGAIGLGTAGLAQRMERAGTARETREEAVITPERMVALYKRGIDEGFERLVGGTRTAGEEAGGFRALMGRMLGMGTTAMRAVAAPGEVVPTPGAAAPTAAPGATVPGTPGAPAAAPGMPAAPGTAGALTEAGEAAAEAARAATGMSLEQAMRAAMARPAPEGGEAMAGIEEGLGMGIVPPAGPGEERIPLPFELPPLTGAIDLNITINTDAMENIAKEQIRINVEDLNTAGPTGVEPIR